MKWTKKGSIFRPDPEFPWMKTYAWAPTAEQIDDDIFKVYFGGRNADNMTQTGWFTFNINNPETVLDISREPILKLGPLGSFDDSLILSCAVVNHDDKKYLYYVGWMQGKRVRYYPALDWPYLPTTGKRFKNIHGAMIERSDNDPYGMASPFVLYDNGTWHLWYASYRRWELRGDEPWPHYEIRYARSTDGVNWACRNRRCIGSEDQEAVARPYILKEDGVFKMWYCYRIKYGNYTIGYAESVNAEDWELMPDKVGIELSDSGPDSLMMAYPCVFNHRGKKYMLYNGNNFGEEGICMAVADQPV